MKPKRAPKGKAGMHPPLLHLKKADPILYQAALPHQATVSARVKIKRTRKDLFAALASSVIGQQLATKAAESIRGRVRELCGGTITPEAIARLTDTKLRKAGLSGAKTKTLKELSIAIRSGELDLLALKRIPEEEAIVALSRIWGIGRWTSEMFLMFALGREDIFSSGDLGLIRAMERLYDLPRETKKEAFERIALAWSPHRSYACLVLWEVRDAPTARNR